MSDSGWERLGAASGLAALVTGAAGDALERGWPSGNDPVAVAAFLAEHRSAILGQSMLFLLSSAFYLWFLGSLRSHLGKAEGGAGRVSGIAFAAGTAWVALSMMAQAFQIGQTMAASAGVQPAMLWTMAAAFAVANLPCAAMLAAVAVVTFRHAAFPRWLGGISVAAAVAQLLLWSGAVVTSGPMAPNGWLNYLLYPLLLIWLVPTAAVMIRRAGGGGVGSHA
jgi:hypothetical protein